MGVAPVLLARLSPEATTMDLHRQSIENWIANGIVFKAVMRF
jgi:hypothetical protein